MGAKMIEIKRYHSGQFMEYMARDICAWKKDKLKPENMLDGYLGYMWLIFGMCKRNKSTVWFKNQYERNKVVMTTLNKAHAKNARFIKGSNIEEKIENYHKMLDDETKRRGGVIADFERMYQY